MTMNNQELAEALFGKPPEAPAKPTTLLTGGSPTAEKPAGQDPTASKPDVPLEHVLFNADAGLEDTFRETMPKLAVALELSEQRTAEMRANHAQLFRDLNIDTPDARNLHPIYAKVMEEAKQGRLPADEEVEKWDADSRQLLSGEYREQAEPVLDKAKGMIASNKDLWSFLEVTGLGSHPVVVRAFMEAARRQR